MSIVQDQPTIHGKQDIYIKQKSVCATLKKYSGGNSKTTTPKDSKRIQKFCRYGELLSMFCPELQKLLKPIYDLIRKGRPFNWGKEQQDSFEEIKQRLIKPPVLHMPIRQEDCICTLIPVNLQQLALCIKYRMANQK